MCSAGSNRAARTAGRTSPSSPTDRPTTRSPRPSPTVERRLGTGRAPRRPSTTRYPIADRTSQGRALPAGSIVDRPDLGDRVLPRRAGASVRGEEPPPAAAAGDDARPGPRVPRRADRRRTQRARRPVRHLPGALHSRSTPTTSSRSSRSDAATTTTTTPSTRRPGSGPRSGGATRSWRGSAPTRRGGPSPPWRCSTTTPARRPRRRSCNARSSRPPGEAWPDRADTIEQAVANSLARWHRIDPGYVADQLAVDHGGRRGAAGRGGVPHPGRGVGPRRPLPRR